MSIKVREERKGKVIHPVVSVLPPALLLLLFQQVQSLSPPVESSVIIKVIETSIVGAALFGTLYIVYRLNGQQAQIVKEMAAVVKQSNDVVLSVMSILQSAMRDGVDVDPKLLAKLRMGDRE